MNNRLWMLQFGKKSRGRASRILHMSIAFAAVFATACAGPNTASAPAPAAIAGPIRAASVDAAATLIRIHGAGEKETLVQDPGWHEYVLEIENLGAGLMIIEDFKILTPSGRYLYGAATYEQITVPPDVAAEVAGEVAERTAGIAAGQLIPYGGQIFGILSGAASSTSDRAKRRAKREFSSRLLNKAELAPGGRTTGSAFLPNVPGARAVVVIYRQGGTIALIDIPLPGK
jgi:hypothetical protein